MGGFDVANRNVFFTHNGNYLGVAFEKVRSNLFPCIAFTSPGEHVIVNFGKYPFLWDFTTKAEPFKPAPLAMVSMYDIPPVRAGLAGDKWTNLEQYFAANGVSSIQSSEPLWNAPIVNYVSSLALFLKNRPSL